MIPRGRLKESHILIGVLLLLALSLMPSHARAQTEVQRLGGKDRFETMGIISREVFESSSCAIVATGDRFPDALTASSLAGVKSCPVILTHSNRLAEEARAELSRLGVTSVFIAGGPNAVSKAVERSIREMGLDVIRVAGMDRVETSIEILKATRAAGSTSDSVIVATGDTFADSLSIGPWAWKTHSPIVLARNGQLSEQAIQAIRADKAIRRIIIVGSTLSVSSEVEEALRTEYSTSRLCGPDRYQTCAAIAAWEGQNGLTWKSPALATGSNFPDALAGSALMGKLESPLLLTNETNTIAHGIITAHAPLISHLYVLGGTSTIGNKVAYNAYWLTNVIA